MKQGTAIRNVWRAPDQNRSSGQRSETPERTTPVSGIQISNVVAMAKTTTRIHQMNHVGAGPYSTITLAPRAPNASPTPGIVLATNGALSPSTSKSTSNAPAAPVVIPTRFPVRARPTKSDTSPFAVRKTTHTTRPVTRPAAMTGLRPTKSETEPKIKKRTQCKDCVDSEDHRQREGRESPFGSIQSVERGAGTAEEEIRRKITPALNQNVAFLERIRRDRRPIATLSPRIPR